MPGRGNHSALRVLLLALLPQVFAGQDNTRRMEEMGKSYTLSELNISLTDTRLPLKNSTALHRSSRSGDAEVDDSTGKYPLPQPDGDRPDTESLQLIAFNPTVGNITLSEHKDVKFNCSIEVPSLNQDLYISWWKDEMELLSTERIVIQYSQVNDNEGTMLLSSCSIASVQRLDNGSYVCKLKVNDREIVSDHIFIQVEGLPYFIQQPEKLNVSKNVPFNLSCEAVGPPGPVQIYWFQNSRMVKSDPDSSPSMLTIPDQQLTSGSHVQSPFLSFAGETVSHPLTCRGGSCLIPEG